MSILAKRVPRLWCARLGLLPFDVELPGDKLKGPEVPRPQSGSTRSPVATPRTHAREKPAVAVEPRQL